MCLGAAMRGLLLLATAALLASPALANHATYIDETRVVGCLLYMSAGGVSAQLNCGVQATAMAAEPLGGSYRLTVEWTGSADLARLQADLISCAGPCVQSGVCINNVCSGGGNLVQQASTVSGSPLVLSIPTAGNEDRVQFNVHGPGPAFASLGSISVRYTLAHVG